MVNTFVTSADVTECARSLDYRRLGKQRVEAYQLHLALTGQRKGWRNHPAAVMWDGFEDALAMYANACIEEWKRRGYRNTMEHLPVRSASPEFPPWWNWEPLILSHKASLNRKDSTYYHFDVPADYAALGYVWPSKVPPHLRWKQDAAASDVCVPISLPAKPASKKRARTAL
jgi:hypothetical protein